jgi:glyoxylase-like metal-dependent hydrolase (beta-lactamase superfamily II)
MQPMSMKVGNLDIVQVYDGQMVYAEPPGFPPKDSPEFEPHRDYITPDGRYLADLGGFLVRTGDRLVLLDAGLGPADHHRHDCGAAGCSHGEYHPGSNIEGIQQYRAWWIATGNTPERADMLVRQLAQQSVVFGYLADSLRRLGVDPADITDVVPSHLHPDHMGWVSHAGASFFPNADIWAHRADVEYFLGENAPSEAGFKLMLGVESTRQRMQPALNQLKIWDTDCTVAPGIDLRHMPGHTPGSSIAVISSQGQRAMLLGDVIHCPLELTSSDFSIMADIDPKLAHASKMKVAHEIENTDIHVASSHFPGLRFGRLLAGEGKKYWSWSQTAAEGAAG